MKAYRLTLILLGLIVALPLTGRLFWIMKKSKPLNILVINKSVENGSENELTTLNWTLNYLKFVNSDGSIFDYKNDYLGYFPEVVTDSRKIKSFKLEEIASIVENNAALFFIDNAGIKYKQNEKKPSKFIPYSGLNQNDYFLLKEMLVRQKLVVAEYNFFSPPTEDLVRYNTEQFLDIYSLGWTGCFFRDLSKEKIMGLVSPEWFDIYKQNYGSDWNFSGPGIILLKQKHTRIIVLPSAKYMSSLYPDVTTKPDIAKEFNIPQKASYTGWFELAYEGKNKVISHLNLNLNQLGLDLLKENGIESEFPIVMESLNKKFYYISGDFSKVEGSALFLSRFGFISRLMMEMVEKNTGNPDKFFQVYYNSFLASVLSDYYSEISVPVKK
jgi:hypothetical protein